MELVNQKIEGASLYATNLFNQGNLFALNLLKKRVKSAKFREAYNAKFIVDVCNSFAKVHYNLLSDLQIGKISVEEMTDTLYSEFPSYAAKIMLSESTSVEQEML